MGINLYGISSILVFVLNFSMTIFVLMKSWKTPLNRVFAGMTLSIAIWGLGGSFNAFIPEQNYSLALFWWQIAYTGVIFVPIFYTHFVMSYLNKSSKLLVSILYLTGIVLAVLNWYDPVFSVGKLRYVFNQFYWMNWLSYKNPVYLICYIGLYWIMLLYSFALLLIHYPTTSGIRKNQVRYFIVGSLVGWAGSHLDYLIPLGFLNYPYYNFLIAIYPFIFAYAIIRYRLLDIKIAITRVGIFVILYATVLGAPFYIGYKTNSWILSTSFAVVFASLGPLAYRRLQRKAENLILAQQRHYQHILMQASEGMVKEHNLNKLLKLTAYIVKRTVGIRFAAIFLYNDETKAYELKAIRNSRAWVDPSASVPANHPIIAHIEKFKEPFIQNEAAGLVKSAFAAFPEEVSLIVPSFSSDKLIGFMVLGNKLNNSIYSQDDINVFKILTQQAALAIENCRFIEEFQKTQERIFSAEKLASIGGLAEGIAHQIRNRLNHFSVTAGELQYEVEDFVKAHDDMVKGSEDLQKTLYYINEIATSFLANVKRTDGIINGILNYARVEAKESYFSQFFLTAVIDLCLDLLRVKYETQTFPLKLDIQSTDLVYGIKSQLMESFFNVLDNAYEATKDRVPYNMSNGITGYEPKILLKITQQPDFTLIEIEDNGIGIKEEDKQKIFAPFFTTKSSYKSGTGIGMYVVKRMVEENHNGKVWFTSTYGEGTRFFIKLPRNKTETQTQSEGAQDAAAAPSSPPA